MVLFFYLFYFFQFCSFVILVNKILKLVCCYLQVLWVTQKVKFWKLSCSKLNFNFVLTSFDFVNRAHHELMLIIMYSSRCIHSYINKWNFEKKKSRWMTIILGWNMNSQQFWLNNLSSHMNLYYLHSKQTQTNKIGISLLIHGIFCCFI